MSPVDAAFEQIPRESFLPKKHRELAALDRPIPIGYGQTNSQPYTVKLMLEWLNAKPGHKVLDVGAGSGWTTALLASIVGEKGEVIGVERIPELARFAMKNCKRQNIANATIHQAKESVVGWPDEAPYNRILVSADPDRMPHELLRQLKSPGRMVIPILGTMHVIRKNKEGKISDDAYPGFMFVPLIS